MKTCKVPSSPWKWLAALSREALGREPLGEAVVVGTVIVDHVVLTHPLHLLGGGAVEGLCPPASSGGVHREAPERGRKRGLGPVCLHQPAAGCPLLRVPQASVETHGLALQVGHPTPL